MTSHSEMFRRSFHPRIEREQERRARKLERERKADAYRRQQVKFAEARHRKAVRETRKKLAKLEVALVEARRNVYELQKEIADAKAELVALNPKPLQK